jgi:hypothetical protein
VKKVLEFLIQALLCQIKGKADFFSNLNVLLLLVVIAGSGPIIREFQEKVSWKSSFLVIPTSLRFQDTRIDSAASSMMKDSLKHRPDVKVQLSIIICHS